MKTYVLGNQQQVSCVAVFSDKKVYFETKMPRPEKVSQLVLVAHLDTDSEDIYGDMLGTEFCSGPRREIVVSSKAPALVQEMAGMMDIKRQMEDQLNAGAEMVKLVRNTH